MNAINVRPPDDFPSQVIMMDKDLAKANPIKGFYLRISLPGGDVELLDLDGMVTPIGARKAALELGYQPTHWCESVTPVQCASSDRKTSMLNELQPDLRELSDLVLAVEDYDTTVAAAALAGAPILAGAEAVTERARKGQRIEQLRGKWNI